MFNKNEVLYSECSAAEHEEYEAAEVARFYEWLGEAQASGANSWDEAEVV